MIKFQKKLVLLVIIFLIIMSVLCYAQETEETLKKKAYRTIAVGFDPAQIILGILVEPSMLVLSGNVEYAVTKNISVLVNFTYLTLVNIVGFQAGGGVRYYLKGQGLMRVWAGGYCDYAYVENIRGFEAAALVGNKIVIGPFFMDPFIGLRIGSIPDLSLLRLGIYIGLTF